MNSRVSLLSMIVLLCMGYVLTRGIEEKRIFSVNLEVVRPWDDCLEQLGNNNNNNNNTYKCEIDLFDPKSVTLANMDNLRYLIKIKIGSKKQEFKVKIDTGSGPLWVFGTECDDSDANCKDHNKYKSGDSDTFTKLDDDFDVKYGTGEVTGISSEDTVYLAEGLEAKKQMFGAASKVTKEYIGYDGILGLNMKKTNGHVGVFSNAASEAGMDPIFSVFIKGGGSSADGGEITFGGVNADHLIEDTKVTVKVEAGVKYMVQMDEVKFGDTSFCTKDGDMNCIAHVDTGCSSLTGPKVLIDAFNKDVLKGTGGGNKEVKCEDIHTFPDMKITFGGKTIVLEAKYYIKEVLGKCYSTLNGRAEKWRLSDPFLVKFFTVFDMKAGDPSVTFYEAK